MSKETHEALVAAAVKQAVEVTEKALETSQARVQELEAKVTSLESDNAGLKADNERINGELDAAQVNLRTSTEKVTELEGKVEKAEQDARREKLATERAEQVKNLGLYDETYVTEQAQRWADLTDEAWSARLDEWKALKAPGTETQETAAATRKTAMSGTTEEITKESGQDSAGASTTPSPRRQVLGLTR
jgi:chromosome segregation ATPase